MKKRSLAFLLSAAVAVSQLAGTGTMVWAEDFSAFSAESNDVFFDDGEAEPGLEEDNSELEVFSDSEAAENPLLVESGEHSKSTYPLCDYNYPCRETETYLPGWHTWINRNFDCWVRDDEDSDERLQSILINDLSIGDDKICCIESEDNDGWSLRMENTGETDITITYTDVLGEEAFKTFHVIVVENYYSATISVTDGRNEILTNSSKSLKTTLSVETFNFDDNSYKEDYIDNYTLQIKHVYDSDLVEAVVDGTNIVVKSKGEPGITEIAVEFLVDGTKVEVQEFRIVVVECYYSILPEKIDSNLYVGESIEIAPQVMQYTTENTNGIPITKDISFEWEYYPEDFKYAEKESGIFSFTRLSIWETDLTCKAVDAKGNVIAQRTWDFEECYYDVFFNDIPDSRIYEDGTQIITLNTDKIKEHPYRVEWQVGRGDGKDHIDNFGADSGIYEVLENDSLKLVGEKMAPFMRNGEVFYVRAIVYAGEVEVQKTDTLMVYCDVQKEYYFDFPENGETIKRLPHWDMNIQREYEGGLANTMNPDGIARKVEVTGVTAQVLQGNENVVEVKKNENGWHIYMNSPGLAQISVAYINFEGEEEVISFNVSIEGDVYEVYISSGSDTYIAKMCPGSSLDLTAEVIRRCFSEEKGEYSGNIDNVTVQWTVADGGEYVTILPSQDTFHLSVKAHENIEKDFVRILAAALVEEPDGQKHLEGETEFWINIRDEFYQIETEDKVEQNLAVNMPITIKPILKRITKDCPEGTVIPEEKVRYHWEWNENALKIQDASGKPLSNRDYCISAAPFTLTKTENCVLDVNLVAELQNEYGWSYETRCSWKFLDQDYSIFFVKEDLRGPDYTWVFNDEKDYTLHVNTENLKDYDNVSLKIQAGIRTEGEPFELAFLKPIDGWKQVGDKIILDGTILKNVDIPKNSRLVINASVMSDDLVIEQREIGFDVSNAWYDYQFPAGDDSCIPGAEIRIPNMFPVYVYNKDYLKGETIQTSVNNLSVQVVDGPADMVSVKKDESGWILKLQDYGHAQVTLDYNLYDGTPSSKPYVFNLYVNNEIYGIYLESSTNSDQLLPGAQMDLTAGVWHFCYNEETGEHYPGPTDDIEVQWTLEYGSDAVKITPDSSNPMLLHVKAIGEPGMNACIKAKAMIRNKSGKLEECAYTDFWVNINENYVTTFAKDVIAEPGQTVRVADFAPEMKEYSPEYPEGVTREHEFVIQNGGDYENILEVSEDKKSIKIKPGVCTQKDDPISLNIEIHPVGDLPSAYVALTICAHTYKLTGSQSSDCFGGTDTYTCTKCGHTKTEGNSGQGHSWDSGTVTTAATCTEEGIIIYTCTRCGATTSSVLSATGHKYGDWETDQEATETETGKRHKTCKNCGIQIFETIPAIGGGSGEENQNVIKDVEVEPGAPDTTMNNGKQELMEALMTDAEKESVKKGENARIWLEVKPLTESVVPAEDKNKIEEKAQELVGKDAAISYIDLSLFKKIGSGLKESIKETTVPISITITIPKEMLDKASAKDHAYYILRSHTENGATISTLLNGSFDAKTGEFTFLTEKFSTYAIVYGAHEHVYGEWKVVKEPTCTEKGSEERSCSACGETEKREVKAKGHTYGEWTVVKEATASKTGKKERICTICNEKQNQTIKTLGNRTDLPLLLAKGTGTKNRISLSWTTYKDAVGYEVYWSYCDGTQNFKKLAATTTKTKASHKKLNAKKHYKYFVIAYKLVDGKKVYIAKSSNIHVALTGSKYTNAKKITVNKTSISLKEGKTFQIKASTTKTDTKKKLLPHAATYRYYTTDKSVATVSKTGVITAKKQGSCTVYVIANNGFYAKIKVKVK